MNYKLKHLSKYCCKPANETEFEAVKMGAELGGVKYSDAYILTGEGNEVVTICDGEKRMITVMRFHEELITVLEYIKKLRMTEEEAMELEDNKVEFRFGYNYGMITDKMGAKAWDGHYFRVSEDGLTVTLHKKEVK